MAKQSRTLLGRDAADILEQGPAWYKVDDRLIYVLQDITEERDPAQAVKDLRAKNKRLAAKAQAEADDGNWLLTARQKAREHLIQAIITAFNLPDTPEETEGGGGDS